MPWLGTFHSIGVKILRRHAELVGLKSDFTILDVDDQIRLLKQLLAAENIDEKRWPARVLAIADRRLEEPRADARAGAARRGRGVRQRQGAETLQGVSGAAEDPQRRRFRRSVARMHPAVPRARPKCLRQYQVRFRFILVDEYQDTNVAQYLWLRLLAQRPARKTSPPPLPLRERTAERSEAGEGPASRCLGATAHPHPSALRAPDLSRKGRGQ